MDRHWSASDMPRGAAYDERFVALAAAGVDVHGEASFVESLLAPGRGAVLDAGCGTGRVGIELSRSGFDVVGVDLDPMMLDEARRKAPDCHWHLADLAELDLRSPDDEASRRRFDAAVLAGNVMIFLPTGSEEQVLNRIAEHLVPGGVVVAGFQLLRDGLTVDAYERYAATAGLEQARLSSTWAGDPFVPGGDYVVAVHRLSAG